MIINKKINQHLRASAPQVKDNEAFMAETIHQINLLPSPESELQESLRRYTLMERLSLRMDVTRWVLLSGSGVAVGSYLMFANYEIVISGVMCLLQIVP